MTLPHRIRFGAIIALVLAVILAGVALVGAPRGTRAETPVDTKAETPGAVLSSLTVLTDDGAAHPFRVEIVATPEARARGLMFRKRMAEDEGMIFVYPRPAPASFWMRNTLIPLDIIFADAKGRVLNVTRAYPLDETPVPSDGAAQFVLEINGGLAEKLGIEAGDRIVSPAMLAAVARSR